MNRGKNRFISSLGAMLVAALVLGTVTPNASAQAFDYKPRARGGTGYDGGAGSKRQAIEWMNCYGYQPRSTFIPPNAYCQPRYYGQPVGYGYGHPGYGRSNESYWNVGIDFNVGGSTSDWGRRSGSSNYWDVGTSVNFGQRTMEFRPERDRVVFVPYGRGY